MDHLTGGEWIAIVGIAATFIGGLIATFAAVLRDVGQREAALRNDLLEANRLLHDQISSLRQQVQLLERKLANLRTNLRGKLAGYNGLDLDPLFEDPS